MSKRILTFSLALLLIITGALAASGEGQTSKKMKAQKVKKHGKEHTCTAACTKESHAYMHMEKGHVCTGECHKKK